jgi:hypothetical protein
VRIRDTGSLRIIVNDGAFGGGLIGFDGFCLCETRS